MSCNSYNLEVNSKYSVKYKLIFPPKRPHRWFHMLHIDFLTLKIIMHQWLFMDSLCFNQYCHYYLFDVHLVTTWVSGTPSCCHLCSLDVIIVIFENFPIFWHKISRVPLLLSLLHTWKLAIFQGIGFFGLKNILGKTSGFLGI